MKYANASSNIFCQKLVNIMSSSLMKLYLFLQINVSTIWNFIPNLCLHFSNRHNLPNIALFWICDTIFQDFYDEPKITWFGCNDVIWEFLKVFDYDSFWITNTPHSFWWIFHSCHVSCLLSHYFIVFALDSVTSPR